MFFLSNTTLIIILSKFAFAILALYHTAVVPSEKQFSIPMNKHLEHFSSKMFFNLLLCLLTRPNLCPKLAKQNPFQEVPAQREKCRTLAIDLQDQRGPWFTGSGHSGWDGWWIVSLPDFGSIFRCPLGQCFLGKERLPPCANSPYCLYTGDSGASAREQCLTSGFFGEKVLSSWAKAHDDVLNSYG